MSALHNQQKIDHQETADQGKNTCLSLSDGQVTKTNKHGYDLNSILDLMSKRVKGSKGFKRCQEHRKNYINWSINQLNFQDIKKINLERLKDVRRAGIQQLRIQ